MRSGSVTQGRMRLSVGLTAAAAALFICGLTLVFIGVGQHLESAGQGRGLVHAGALIAICGFAFGVALLAVLAADLGGRGLPSHAAVPAPAAVPAWQLSPPSVREAVPPALSPEFADAGGGYGYTDDGWDPEFGPGWSPGPGHVWASAGGDHRGNGAADGWALDGRDEWDPAGLEDWDGSGQLWSPAGWDAPALAAEPVRDEPAMFSVWEPAPKNSVWEPGPKLPPPGA